MEEVKQSELVKAVINVMLAIDNVEKNLTVGGAGASYKGVSDADVKVLVRRLMAENGLIIMPVKVKPKVTVSEWFVEEKFGNAPPVKKRKKEVFTSVTTTYKLMHVSGEYEYLQGSGQGVDTQDKSIGKATTYALKYALLYLFLVPSGEIDDSDKHHSNDTPPPAADAKKTKANVSKPLEKKEAMDASQTVPPVDKTLLPAESIAPVEPAKQEAPAKRVMTESQVIAYVARIPNESDLLGKIKEAFELTAEQVKRLEEAQPKQEGVKLPTITMGEYSAYAERIRAGEPGVIPECQSKFTLTEGQLESLRSFIPKLGDQPKEQGEAQQPEIKKIKEAEFRALQKAYKGGDFAAFDNARSQYLPFTPDQEVSISKYVKAFNPSST